MAVKSTLLGGTDWSDGDILYSADLLNTIEIIAPASFDTSGGSQSIGTSETQVGSDVSVPSGLLSDYIVIRFNCSAWIQTSTGSGSQVMSYHIYHWDGATETLLRTVIPSNMSGSFDTAGEGVSSNNADCLIEHVYTLTASDKSDGFSIRIKASQNTTGISGNQTATWTHMIIQQLSS